jgi:hypothetical protein
MEFVLVGLVVVVFVIAFLAIRLNSDLIEKRHKRENEKFTRR